MRENQFSARKTTPTKLTFGMRLIRNALFVWFLLIRDDLNWGRLPIVYLSVCLNLILFFSKNNDFRTKMYRTLKIDLFIRYNFCENNFFPRLIFIDIKYVGLVSFKVIGSKWFLEVQPNLVHLQSLNHLTLWGNIIHRLRSRLAYLESNLALFRLSIFGTDY